MTVTPQLCYAAMSEAGLTPRLRATTSSAYDFVKVRIWLGVGEQRHAVVFSRFLLVRSLTAARVPYDAAVKVALDVKKELVDGDQLDVEAAAFEDVVFRVMRRRQYGENFISLYREVTAFHTKRAPLIVLIGGGICTCKSTVAASLAQRLNLPNVLQTDVIAETLSTLQPPGVDLFQAPLWARADTGSEALLQSYTRECASVCAGIRGELSRCLRHGKALVVEGLHCHANMIKACVRDMVAASSDELRQPVLVAFMLTMAHDDRQVLLGEWASQRSGDLQVDLAGLLAKLELLDTIVATSSAASIALRTSPSLAVSCLGTIHDRVLELMAHHGDG